MQRTSFEKSLAFLAPNLTSGKKKKVVSPVRVPEHNEEDLLDIESLLKGDSPVVTPKSESYVTDEGVMSDDEEDIRSDDEEEEDIRSDDEEEEDIRSERDEEEDIRSERDEEEDIRSDDEEDIRSDDEEDIRSDDEEDIRSDNEEDIRSDNEEQREEEEDIRSDNEEQREEEEDIRSDDEESERDYEDELEVKSVTDSDSEEEDIREEIEITTRKGIQTLTPKRFKIKVPKSPVVKKEITEITDKLNSYRYNIIKFIFNEENSLIDYVICFDPNGEIVFIELDKEKVKVFDEEKIIKINYKDEGNTMSSSFIEGVRNKITYDVYGVVFFDGIDYVIMKRDSEGTIYSDTYTTVDTTLDKKANIPFVYSIIKLSHLLKSPLETIKRTKLTYQVIQNQQINTNKSTIKNLMETTKELTDKIYQFDRVYKRVTKDIVADWKTLSTYSSDYYGKFHEDELTEEDKESFDQVTVNMFVRFQIFNEQVENVNNLYKAIDRINHSIFTINETILRLEEKNDKIKNRIIEIDEMQEYI